MYVKKVTKIKKVIERGARTVPPVGVWPDYCRTMLICVDSFQNRLAAGRIYNCCCSHARIFPSLDQMLFEIESILDENGLVQRWNQPRTLLPSKPDEEAHPGRGFPALREPALTPQQLQAIRGKVATVHVRIHSMQNASIQGVFELLGNQGARVYFRSALELAHLVWETAEILDGHR